MEQYIPSSSASKNMRSSQIVALNLCIFISKLSNYSLSLQFICICSSIMLAFGGLLCFDILNATQDSIRYLLRSPIYRCIMQYIFCVIVARMIQHTYMRDNRDLSPVKYSYCKRVFLCCRRPVQTNMACDTMQVSSSTSLSISLLVYRATQICATNSVGRQKPRSHTQFVPSIIYGGAFKLLCQEKNSTRQKNNKK